MSGLPYRRADDIRHECNVGIRISLRFDEVDAERGRNVRKVALCYHHFGAQLLRITALDPIADGGKLVIKCVPDGRRK
jgi:hypothetical protein